MDPAPMHDSEDESETDVIHVFITICLNRLSLVSMAVNS